MKFKTRNQRQHDCLTFEEEFGLHLNFKGGGSSTTVQKTELDPIQRQALQNVISKSEQEFAKGPQQFFPGQTLAGVDPLTTAGQQQQLGQVSGLQQFGQEQLAAASRGLNLDLTSSPETQRLADAVVKPLQRQFEEQTLPAISSAAVQQGAFGGARQDISEAQAARDFSESALDARARVLLDAQRAGLDQQARVLGLAPQIAAGQLLPGQAVQDIGQQLETRSQQEIEADRERFEFEQIAPGSALDQFVSRVTGINLGPTLVGSTQSSGGGLFGK